MFIHVLKTRDHSSAATATSISLMSICPQREAHFVLETEPRKSTEAYQPFSPGEPHRATSVWGKMPLGPSHGRGAVRRKAQNLSFTYMGHSLN